MNREGELSLWTIALVAQGRTGRAGSPYVFADAYPISTMPWRSSKGTDRYSIGVLTDPSDEGIDVGLNDWTFALDETIASWKRKGAKNQSQPTQPSGRALRDLRSFDRCAEGHRGLLLLYPLSPWESEEKTFIDSWDKPIMGFAVSFPSSGLEVSVEYKVDHLLWEEQYGSAD
jgi:hypothetical protein